jgi:hypothetical protein
MGKNRSQLLVFAGTASLPRSARSDKAITGIPRM